MDLPVLATRFGSAKKIISGATSANLKKMPILATQSRLRLNQLQFWVHAIHKSEIRSFWDSYPSKMPRG